MRAGEGTSTVVSTFAKAAPVVAVSATTLLVAAADMHLHPLLDRYAQIALRQYYVSATAICLFCCTAILARRRVAVWLGFVLAALLATVAASYVRTSVAALIALWAPIAVATAQRTPLHRSSWLALSLLLIAGMLDFSGEFFGVAVPQRTAGQRIALLCALSVIAGVARLIVVYHSRLQRLDARAHRMERAVARLTDETAGYQRIATEVSEQAVSQERARVTREIHDAVGHALTNIVGLAEMLTRSLIAAPEQVRELVRTVLAESRRGLQDLRMALRAERAQSVPVVQGKRAMRRLVETFSLSTGVKVDVEFNNAQWQPGGDIDLLFLRVLQETLSNSFHHGAASRIDVRFWQIGATIELVILDNGTPPLRAGRGIGLSSIAERADSIGARVSAGPTPVGFRVQMTVPIGASV